MINNDKIEQLLSEVKPIYEPSVLDFKKSEQVSSSLLETVSAFANTDGGDIILGIHQKPGQSLKYIGIQSAQDQESKIRDIMKNKMVNILEGEYQISIENFLGRELPLIKIKIERLEDPMRWPVYIKDRGIFKGSYIRIGQRDEIMPAAQIKRAMEDKMIMEKKLPRTELQTIEGTSIKDLDMDIIRDFAAAQTRGVDIDGLDGRQLNNFLEVSNILSSGSVTIFGMVCFGKNPQQYLTYQSSIQVTNNTGIDVLKGERGKNKDIFEGSLKSNLQNSLNWSIQNLPSARIVGSDGKTENKPDIPPRVLREILVNAFCHKDYKEDEKTLIKISGNHFSITNPGVLQHRIYKDRFIMPGSVDHQNPSIAKYLLKILEAEGEGKGFTVLLKSCLDGDIDIPSVDFDFSGRVTVDISGDHLINKEIEVWLQIKKYAIKTPLDNYDKVIMAYLYKANDLINQGKFAINLSEECLNPRQKVSLDKLLQNSIVEEKTFGSTKIFILSEELLRHDYSNELFDIYGEDFFALDGQSKIILSYIIQFSKINEPASASKLSRALYPNASEEKVSGDIPRAIRKKCNILLKKGFLERDKNRAESSPKGNLLINYSYRKKNNVDNLESETQNFKQTTIDIDKL